MKSRTENRETKQRRTLGQLRRKKRTSAAITSIASDSKIPRLDDVTIATASQRSDDENESASSTIMATEDNNENIINDSIGWNNNGEDDGSMHEQDARRKKDDAPLPYSYHASDFDIIDIGKKLHERARQRKGAMRALDQRIMADASLLTVNEEVLLASTLSYLATLQEEIQRKAFIDYMSKVVPNGAEIFEEVSHWHKPEKDALVVIEYCPCGNTVYAGSNSRDHCSNCNEFRFENCKTCNVDGFCSHQLRTPKAILQYRPLLQVVRDLVSKDFFLKALRYTNESLDEEYITDLLDAEVPQKNLMEMRQTHQRRNDSRSQLKPIYLLLQEGWDGGQLFKSKSTNFEPLVISIINLPPSMRKQDSVGIFVLATFTGPKAGSLIEKFLFIDCLVKELNALEEGVEMENFDGTKVMVYARLISHTLDTRAIEKVLRTKSVAAKRPCMLCRKVSGTRSNQIGNVIYEGGRYLLPLNHFLRSKGQSQNCCPLGFYTGDEKAFTSLLDPNEPVPHHSSAAFRSRSIVEKFSIINKLKSCTLTEEGNTAVIQMLKQNDAFEWYNESVGIDAFSEHLYYHHCDYREQEEYSRVSNKTYISEGLAAANMNGGVEHVLMSKENKKDKNGLLSVWMFANLKYANIEDQVSFDPFHTLKCVGQYHLALWCSDGRKYSENIKNHAKNTLSHPCLFRTINNDDRCLKVSSSTGTKKKKKGPRVSRKTTEPWILDAEVMKELDEAFDCILFPAGYSNSYKIKKPFQNNGQLTGVLVMLFTTSFADFVIMQIIRLQPDYPSQYLAFTKILSEIFCSLQQPVFAKDDLLNLLLKTIEVVEVHVGLYSIAESKFMWHELVEVAQYIKSFGPIHGWWTLPTERMIAQLKCFVNKGGRNFNWTLFNQYSRKSIDKTHKFYDAMSSSTSRDSNTGSIAQNQNYYNIPCKYIEGLSPDEKGFMRRTRNGELIYSHYTMKLKSTKKEETTWQLNIMEQNSLLLIAMHEVWKAVQGCIYKAVRNSRLVRLWFSFCILQPSNKESKEPLTFVQYLRCINLPFSVNMINVDSNRTLSCIENDNEILHHVLKGGVYEEDLVNLEIDFAETSKLFKPDIFDSAFIYGLRFPSRGAEFSEREMVATERDSAFIHTYKAPEHGSNKFEDLKTKKQRSSWFRFKFFGDLWKTLMKEVNEWDFKAGNLQSLLDNTPKHSLYTALLLSLFYSN